MVKRLLTAALLMVSGFAALAQDIHYTMFDMSPMTLNPAITGNYEGTFRVGGIYRDQWASLIENQYVTPSVYLDAPLLRGFGQNDWIGAGIMVFNDQAGAGVLQNTTAMLSAAYHLGLGQQSNTHLSLGLQGGLVQKRVDISLLEFASNYIGNGQFDPNVNPEILQNSNVSYPDFQAGVAITTAFSKRANMLAGFSAFHLSAPEENFLTISDNLARRFIGHAAFNFDLGTRLVLSPMAFYQTQATASELNTTVLLGIHLNNEKDITFRVGGGYRLNDAAIARLGFDFKGFRVSAAYDINTSGLSNVTNGNGGFEIAAQYVARIFRTPVIKPVLFCPRF